MSDFAEWCRFVLATVFLLAGVAKLGDRRGFADAVAGYGLLPDRLTGPVARLLPPVEIAAALLLAAGPGNRVVAAGLGALLLVFAGAVAVNLARGRRMSCACFGTSVEQDLTWFTVARNLGLVAAAGVVVAVGGTGGATAPMLVAGTATVLLALLGTAALPVVRGIRRLEVAG